MNIQSYPCVATTVALAVLGEGLLHGLGGAATNADNTEAASPEAAFPASARSPWHCDVARYRLHRNSFR